MKYKFEYESENAEQDFAQIMDILMSAVERGVKIYKDVKSVDAEAEKQQSIEKLNENVEELSGKLDDFREVVTAKK